MNRKAKTKKNYGRRAGILMPISSLPSDCGIGTLGAGAYAFVDWLQSAGMKIWQVLPLLPTGYGDSPYQSFAADALNYYFIDFKMLTKEGLLVESEYLETDWGADDRRVDYGLLFEKKAAILRLAYGRFNQENADWKRFIAEEKYLDFAIFMSLKEDFSYAPWDEWTERLRSCDQKAVDAYVLENTEKVRFWQFTQFLFLRQWNALRAYAKEKGVLIMGDMPIYVSYDSVETWKYREKLFTLDKQGNVALRAGVPPDAFSEDGQFWGNPVYDWARLKKDGYAWWKDRISYAFSLFDIVRIDHFRAFDRFYAIPAGATTAKEGDWMDGPKEELFEGLDDAQIVAEDLGVIDDGVRRLLKNTGYPGMKIFQFAFDGNPENEYLPSAYTENCVAYTGTHDNDTLRSFIEEMENKERKDFEKSFEEECLKADVPYLTETLEEECESVIRLLFSSKADTVLVPMHDVLCFGKEARLNAPATVSSSNWTFRFTEKDFKKRKAIWLKEMTEEYGR